MENITYIFLLQVCMNPECLLCLMFKAYICNVLFSIYNFCCHNELFCFRQQLERLPRRQTEPSKPPTTNNTVPSQPEPTTIPATVTKTDSQFLLAK